MSGDKTGALNIDWNKSSSVSKTDVTLQVVENPKLRRGSDIHDRAWAALRNLNTDFVRFALWFPYPRLAVAELNPPENGKTFWDFSQMDPLVEDFFAATTGHPIVMTISTIPQWMFKTERRVAIVDDPNEAVWNYEQGTELRDPTMKEVADYFGRVASWYTAGGFTDELGTFHPSGHHYKIDYWEVLNEPEYEHQFGEKTCTQFYDAVVKSVRAATPKTKFVGMSLAEPQKKPRFFEYFLNPGNHAPGIPLDMISYHFYAVPEIDESSEMMPYTFFAKADGFLNLVRYIESIRQRLSPDTRTDINETGCILSSDISQDNQGTSTKAIPNSYWNLCGATFAYLYAGLARQGIDIVGASQLVGYPSQFPSVTMLDWNTGQPNARYWVLKMLHDNFGPGDRIVDATGSAPAVFAQGFIRPDGTRKILLINKRDHVAEIDIAGASGGHETHVDQSTGFNPPASSKVTTDRLTIQGFGVMVLTMPQ